MSYVFAPGATSKTVDIRIVDDSGLPVPGLVAATMPTIKYSLAGANADATITLADLATLTTAWASGGVFERGEGVYRLDLPDAALATAGHVELRGEATDKRVICGPIFIDRRLPDALPDEPDGLITTAAFEARTLAAASYATAAALATLDDILDTEFPALTTEVGKIPKSDGSASWNATALAAIQSEANDALVANHLDHLIGVADPGGVVANNSFLAKLVSKSATAAFSDYVNTTDSLQALRDNMPANFNGLVIDASGVVSADLQEILGYTLGSGVTGNTDRIGDNFEEFFFNNETQTSSRLDDIETTKTYLATNLGLLGANATEAGGTGDHLTALATQASVDAVPTVTEIWTTALTEAYRATGATGTGAQLLYELLANLINFANSGTTKTVTKLDKSTTAKTYTYDDGTTPTAIEETT
jgi:hypothetical protein